MKNHRFHVHLGPKRTTVSLDPLLAALIALSKGIAPDAPEAHSAVRKTLQEHLDRFPDAGRVNVSQWLKGEVILSFVDNNLSESYLEWLENGAGNTEYDHTPMEPLVLDGPEDNYSP